MKRKLKWLAIVLAVALLGFGTALLLWPRDRITAESWQKIRIGMTEEEVENILGSSATAKILGIPDGVFLCDEGVPPNPLARPWRPLRPDKHWLGRRGLITIAFDDEGHVGRKSFYGWRSGFWDGLREWLGW